MVSPASAPLTRTEREVPFSIGGLRQAVARAEAVPRTCSRGWLRCLGCRSARRACRDVPTFDLPLVEIRELDEDYWFGAGDTPTVLSLVEHWELSREVDLSYPIVVDPAGRVMDGMHHVARALMDGSTTVPAKRLPEMPAPNLTGVRDPNELPY